MTFASELVSRLQDQRNRIQGMLSPGTRKEPGSENVRLSPVAADFAGRKFQLAAKEMRVLSVEKANALFSKNSFSLSGDVLGKFKAIEQIIHINPRTTRESGIWSEVEATLPGGREQTIREVPQPEDGILRQGSIIRKMKTVPDPGQSIDSFRREIESQPRSVLRTQSRNRKPAISPGDRMFSRVQEIKPGQQENDSSSKKQAALEAQKEHKHTKASESKPTPKATVQRELAKPSEVQSKIEPEQVNPKIDLPIEKQNGPAKNQVMNQSSLQSETVEPEQNIEDDKQGEAVQQEMPEFEASVVEDIKKIDMPVVRSRAVSPPKKTNEPRLLKAKSVKKEKKTRPAIKKALPVQPEKNFSKAPVKQANQVARPLLQRAKDDEVQREPVQSMQNTKPGLEAQKEEKRTVKAEADHQASQIIAQPSSDMQPAKKTLLDEADATGKHDAIITESEPGLHFSLEADNEEGGARKALPTLNDGASKAASDMPLMQILSKRRQIAKSVKRRDTPVMKTRNIKPEIAKITTPLVTARATSKNVVSREVAYMPTVHQTQPTMRTGNEKSQELSNTSVPPTVTREAEELEDIPLELAQAFKVDQAEIVEQEKPLGAQRLSKPRQRKNAQDVSKGVASTSVAASTGVVQRLWDEHAGMGDEGAGNGASG